VIAWSRQWFQLPVLSEYHAVLHRAVLHLDPDRVDEVLSALADEALHVEPFPLDPEGCPDPFDVPFYATAMACLCPLVTGNLKHFPNDGPVLVLSPREAVERLHLS